MCNFCHGRVISLSLCLVSYQKQRCLMFDLTKFSLTSILVNAVDYSRFGIKHQGNFTLVGNGCFPWEVPTNITYLIAEYHMKAFFFPSGKKWFKCNLLSPIKGMCIHLT